MEEEEGEQTLQSQDDSNFQEQTDLTQNELPEVNETEASAAAGVEEETNEQHEAILEQDDMIQPDTSQLDEITLDQEGANSGGVVGDETGQDASFQNETNEEDQSNLDQTIDSTANENELTQSIDETNDQKDDKKDAELEAIQHKKELMSKRKARNPNRFADGNLIPEEIDEESTGQIRSPGPPPLEPISQNLDDLNINIQKNKPEILGVTSPDKMDITLDDDYQEIEVEIKPSRDELMAKYYILIKERDELQNTNNQLHHKLADYFRKKKSEEAQNQPLFDKTSQEQEQRYLKYLSTIEQLRKQLDRERQEAEREIEDLKDKCEMKQKFVNDDRMQFIKNKRESATKSVSLYTGRAPNNKEIDAIMQREQQKEYEVVSVRLENIKLKNQLKKREQELKAKEELGEGLHMIDFEQLKIENQTYNEKIEERNEELMKLKKKINNTVQILTHVKEKLQFVLAENEKEKSNLNTYDENVKKNRDVLNKIKQSRDSLRIDNLRLKQNSGLLGNTVLLRDFEECVDKNDIIETQIEHLKRKHAELLLSSKGLKQKIAQAKPEKQL